MSREFLLTASTLLKEPLDTIAALRASSVSGFSGGELRTIKGYYAAGDCRERTFFWDSSVVPRPFTATAANDTFTLTAHGFNSGRKLVLAGGSLPAGSVAGTTYYAVRLSANTFKIATTHQNAVALTPVVVNLTTDGSGTVNLADDDGSLIGSSSAGKWRCILDESSVPPEYFGAKGDNIQDDTAYVQKTWDWIETNRNRGTCRLTPGKRYKITSELILDITFVNLDAYGAILDAATMTSGNALRVKAKDPDVIRTTRVVRGLEMEGPGVSSSVTAMHFEGELYPGGGSVGPYQVSAYDCGWHFFGVAVDLYDFTSMNNFYNCFAIECGRAYQQLSGGLDYGERNTVIGGEIMACTTGIYSNGLGEWHVYATSFDGNTRDVELRAARMWATDCHFEPTSTTSSSVYVGSEGESGFFMQGGVIANFTEPGVQPSFVECYEGSDVGGARFSDVHIVHFRSSGNVFATGTGHVEMERCTKINTGATAFPLEGEAWQNLTLSNSWVQASGTAPPQYRRDSHGIVYLRGTVVNGTAATIATLPAGYRPPYLINAIARQSGDYSCDLQTGGQIVGSVSGSGAYVALDNLRFRTL